MFGSHLSIAGGMTNALHEAERLGMECVQVFTKNQQQWNAPPLDGARVADWTAEVARLGWQERTVSHASYLINLASPDPALHARSVDLMQVEIERCEALGIPFLVHHPGAATDGDPDAGAARIARAYRELSRRTKGYRTVSCLENTVGSGTNLGRTFEELARLRSMILEAGADPARVAFCFDTCHAHAGGYDLSEREGAARALDDFDSICGEGLMRVVHLNDSKGAVASRLDRHAHIGEGTIGGSTRAERLARTGFAAVVNRQSLRAVPKVLETPKGTTPKGTPHDTINLRRLKRLRGS